MPEAKRGSAPHRVEIGGAVKKALLDEIRVEHPADCGELVKFAATELARGLAAMRVGEQRVELRTDPLLAARQLRVRTMPLKRASASDSPGVPGQGGGVPPDAAALLRTAATADGFALWRETVPQTAPARSRPAGALMLAGGSDRAVLHAACAILERLGARFSPAAPPSISTAGAAGLARIRDETVAPAFSRRAVAADIMTWHYETPERLATHLAYDHDFIAWMGARGLNAFSWIRHAVDSRLKIDELAPALRERGIAAEYGGHVLPLLMPRDRFDQHPEYFPVDAEGNRNAHGNLCVSSRDALSLVRDGALSCLRDNPACALLHVWGADVWDGAWCRCAECAALSPQLQYMKVVNTIADALASVPDAPSIAYLAYHDTIGPDPALRPRTNVAFEWAPRERCYNHAIDDVRCEVNPRYLESLKRYLELFDGRGHVFEYYADAILFGGIAVATPAVIARDLRAYRALGLTSVSCLTFGMHSALAYPVNLEAFARATRSPDFEPALVLADTVARIHPRCVREMAPAYRAIARASSLILDGGGELMPPNPVAASIPARRRNLARAIGCIDRALSAADHIGAASHSSMAAAEREVWHYSREVVSGIAEYLAATAASGTERGRRSEAAITNIGGALHRLRDYAPAVHDTWAAWDLEWITDRWLKALRRRFDQV